MTKPNFRFKSFLFLTLFLFSFLTRLSFADVLSDWQDAKAYKPEPVLFLHGFSGKPSDWNSAISNLSQWFTKYQTGRTYLEKIDFQDYLGSISTYKNGKPGWADRLNQTILDLLSSSNYGSYTKKLNLVAHSMGGLAAREYLANTKYPSGYVDKLILIGTPNLGSPMASFEHNFIVIFKISSFQNAPVLAVSSVYRNNTNSIAKLIWIPNFNLSPGLTQMFPGSSFLNSLNNRTQPAGVKYEGIYGITGHIFNWLFLGWNYYGGDGIVGKDSQLGIGHVTFLKTPYQIHAFHFDEPDASVLNDNPLLRLLDSDEPQFEIASPDPSTTTTITTSSIDIEGKVYKEYLPADSQLIVNVTKQDDGTILPTQTFSLKPSGLWIPNNPDSPVAEFKETLSFPSNGAYKISCQIQNPAKVVSIIKDVYVKVTAQESASIIVHCHNPEGKEINSITGVGLDPMATNIYDGDTLIGHGAYNAATHNQPIDIATGAHRIRAIFNGIELTQDINLANGQQQVLTFEFSRTTFDLQSILDSIGEVDGELINLTFDNPPNGWCYDFNKLVYSSNGIKSQMGVYLEWVGHFSADYYFNVNVNRNRVNFNYGAKNITASFIRAGGRAAAIISDWSGGDGDMFYQFSVPSFHNDTFDSWYIQKKPAPIRPLVMGDTMGIDYVGLQNSGGYECILHSAKLANPMISIGLATLNVPWAWVGPLSPTNQEGAASGDGYDLHCDQVFINSIPFDSDGHAV